MNEHVRFGRSRRKTTMTTWRQRKTAQGKYYFLTLNW